MAGLAACLLLLLATLLGGITPTPRAVAAAPTPSALDRDAYLQLLHRALDDVTAADGAADDVRLATAARVLAALPAHLTIQDAGGALADVDLSGPRDPLQQDPPDLQGARSQLTALLRLLDPGSLPTPTLDVPPTEPSATGTTAPAPPAQPTQPAYLPAGPGGAPVPSPEAGRRLDQVLADPRFQPDQGTGIQKALAGALAPAVQFLLQMPDAQRNLLIAAVVGLLVAFLIYSGYRDAPWSVQRYWGTIAAGGLGSAALVMVLLTYLGTLLAVFGGALLPAGAALGVLVAIGVVSYLTVNLRRERVRSGARLAGAFAAEAGWTAAQARDAAARAARAADYRQAIRYRYLATLLALDESGRVRFDPALTNQEYLRRAPASLHEGLRPLVQIFDRLWYGGFPAGAQDYQDYQALAGRAESAAAEPPP